MNNKPHRQVGLFTTGTPKTRGSDYVTCLGLTFTNDEERRKYFIDKLREKLKDPEFRRTEGFPHGTDEDILALSDPPYYTACPNPWLGDLVEEWEAQKLEKPANASYHREPFAVDTSEGKTHALYKAHSYHTKVPHLAIVPSLLHYTDPGDIVLDGFCGSGMIGVAAQWCGTAPRDYRRNLEAEWAKEGRAKPEWGIRHVVLNDLSPAATFIAANHNLPFDIEVFDQASKRLLDEVEQELGWMYETLHTDGKTKGRIEYTLWSEVFTCPDCTGEVVFLDEALDMDTRRVKDAFPCPQCGCELTKQRLDRLYVTTLDRELNKPIQTPKRKPSLISYSLGGRRLEKAPDAFDLEILKRIDALPLPSTVPTTEIPPMHMTHERARMDKAGVTHIHHFFLPRAGQALGAMWQKANVHPELRTRSMLLFFVEQAIWTCSVLNRYQPQGYKQVNKYLPGVYYVPSQTCELSPWYAISARGKRIVKTFSESPMSPGNAIVGTTTAEHLELPNSSIDYIFTDPPFGENIYYADLNFLVESWHQVLTNATPEAIVDRFKKKGLPEYQHLMQHCFKEYYRVLKPGRWMTVVFHNSHNAVWIAIQEALTAAGFVVASVATLNKQQGSYRQVTSAAMKEDLVVSTYKPNDGLEERFALEAGTEDGAWDFLRSHLRQLPVIPKGAAKPELIAERLEHRLYDLMVAFHVQRGFLVPLSAAEFALGLNTKKNIFDSRDEMWFLSEQVVEYDRWREKIKDLGQLEGIPSDELSTLRWLRQQLKIKPQTLQDLTPLFLRLTTWSRHEKPIELSLMLEQNFLRYDGKGLVPEQIHAYLSTNWKDLRNLSKDNPALVAKARDRWYVPDPNKAGDLEKLRERSLLKEFEDYRTSSHKRLKVFRLEAVRAGFKKAWQERDYTTIISVACKIPENVLQEDPKLLMWYDQATTRTGGQSWQ
jgi:DNA modification methylase